MSQAEFARLLGDHLGHPVSQSQISDWERGRFEAGGTVLLAVAELAGHSIDELRGAGPPALMDRIARLEDQLDAAVEAPTAGSTTADDVERIGRLLTQIIQVLDHAGLWPSDDANATHERGAGRGRARTE